MKGFIIEDRVNRLPAHGATAVRRLQLAIPEARLLLYPRNGSVRVAELQDEIPMENAVEVDVPQELVLAGWEVVRSQININSLFTSLEPKLMEPYLARHPDQLLVRSSASSAETEGAP